MKLTHMLTTHVEIGIPLSVGEGQYGRRVFYPITSGTFEGSEPGGTFNGKPLRGQVVAGGGDWVLIKNDVSRLDVRITLQTDDGWCLYLQSMGVITVNDAVRRRAQDPNLITEYGETYFMTQPRFETGDNLDAQGNVVKCPYSWLNDVVLVGEGKLGPSFPGFITAKWLETRSYIVGNGPAER